MVHQYKLNGFNIVLDTCSGAIHVVDEVAYDIIAMIQEKSAREITTEIMNRYGHRDDVTEEEVGLCIEDVNALIAAGKLYTPDTFASMAGTFKERSGDVVKALCLHVAHTCNLNCGYCFASQGKYHGDRALMSFEVGKQALDFLMDHSGTRRNLEVDFFGGEPLMNWDVVKQLVLYARSVEKERGKNFRFTLTTNGVLIDDDVIEFTNKEMSNVVLSLDGRKEINDRTRVDYAGNGSYDRIVPKCRTYLPQSSFFGMLLEREEPHTIIKSRQLGLLQHEPYSWDILGANFVPDTQNADSLFVDKTMKSWLASMTMEERNEFFDGVFGLLMTDNTASVWDMLKPQTMLSYIRNLRTNEPMRNMLTAELDKLIQSAKQVTGGMNNE